MKITQFSGWVVGQLSGGLTGKTAQFFEGDRDRRWVFVRPICAIYSISRMGKVSNLYVIFEGSQSRGGYRVRLSGWPAWRLSEFLVSSAAWKALLLEGSLVIKTSTKWLSVWTNEICKCDLTNTHPHDLTMRWLKPTRHTCSTWLTDGASDKRDTRDWSLINHDDTCVIVNVTPCASATDVFIANITGTHKAKTLSMTKTWLQARHWHQHAEAWVEWTSKVGVKAHMSSQSELECMQPSSETLKGGSKFGCRLQLNQFE